MRKLSTGIKPFAFILSVLILFSSCASTTMIQSTPPSAKVYLNEEFVGDTPYEMTDTKIVGSKTTIRIEKKGYEEINTIIIRNEKADGGAIVGGIFCLILFLWVMEYKPIHNYTLTPVTDSSK